MDPIAQAASRIIKEQQTIIGPLALEQAKKVSGLTIKSVDDIVVTGDHKAALNNLVNQFSKIFGQASIQVCKDAFEAYQDKIPATEIPDVLKS